MAKTKRVSYAGIPAKHRSQVAKLLHLQAAGLDFTGDDPQTPQEAWAALNAHWAKKREEVQAKKDQAAKARAEGVRKCAIEALMPAIEHLWSCRMLALAIEEDCDDSYLDHQEMASFIRIGLDNAGRDLEQRLCNLGLVAEEQCGLFLDGERKSDGIKKETDPEEEETEEQEVAHA